MPATPRVARARPATPHRATHTLLLALMCPAAALAQPAQRPLLSSTVGATPNLMITLDNSASMTKPFADDYIVGAERRANDGTWAAQRSAEINPLYYNPRITYLPRVDAGGNPLVPTDGVVFISNQTGAPFDYKVYSSASVATADAPVVVHHSSYAARPAYPSTWNQVSSETETYVAPVHVAYSAATVSASSPAFSYAVCTAYTKSRTSQTCGTWTTVNVRWGSTATITLPTDNNRRTDCGPTPARTCTTGQEIANILNWYRYYLYRMPATVTAIGQALADPRLNGRLRVGHFSLNFPRQANPLTPGTDVNRAQTLRGVRPWVEGSADKAQVYDWLYNQLPMGATPLHNAVEKVATYLRVPAGARENPWSTDPTRLHSTDNPELSCRRSYHLIFSDGAWSTSSSTNRGEDHDNTAGPLFRVGAGSITDPEYQYRPRGASSLRDYTPYPGTGTGGLTDLTAKYRWHTDFRPDLRNDIATYPGQPVFWQDMTTYTVGYLIEPSGETFGATSGLTFRQIEAYQTGFARNGFTATTQPSWPTGDLTSATETRRVDDFIQAGFTGGGRGFSVSNADSIRGVFDAILSDILNANGVDAGGDISNEENGVASPVGRLKYRVSYRTRDNSGEIEARQLDANGVPVLLSRDINGTTLSPPSYAFWTAGRQLPAHTARRVFSIREGNVGFEFRGRFDALPAITQTTMRAGVNGGRIPGDTTFVDYLRGSSDVLADNAGRLLRVRSGPIGAIVNAPPLFVGPDGDLGYDAFGDVSGQASYAAFRSATSTATPALFAATNAGVVHVLDAWRGQEQAAFMPRRSLKPLIDQAMPYATFAYNLDGPLTAHDLYNGLAWNQVVVGTGGRGEKLMYALRYPMKADGTRTPDASDFLWEAGPEDLNTTDVTMGHLTTPVRAGQTASGHWVMLTSSGHHGTPDGSRAGLLVIDAFRGTLIRSIPLPSGFSAGRGMGAVTRIIDRRQRIVGAYVGDARGQLWRFDLRGTPETWTVSYGRPLFVTPGNRPIYGGPSWQLHPQRGTVVVFATGLLMDEADPAAVSTDEGIYGIWDPTSPGQPDNATFTTVVPTDLLQQRIGRFQAATPDGSRSYYSISQNPIDWTVHRGWTLPMGTIKRGERNIDQVRNFGNRVLINTVAIDGQSPTERCDAGAAPPNILYSLRALDGGGGPTFDTRGATALAPGVGPNPEAAMAIMELGGFTRGVAVTRSGSGVTTRTPEQGDSVSPLRLLSGSHQNSGEDSRAEASSCTGLVGGIGGDGGSQGATTGCGPQQSNEDPDPEKKPTPWSDTPWSRQQYPLLQVPR